jgi:acyl-CoA hydrolase
MQHFSFRELVHPEHLNAAGVLYGGTTLFWLDKAAAMYAMCQMGTKQIVTASISQIDFKTPVQLGDCLEFYAKTLRIGTSSLTIQVDAYINNFESSESTDLDKPVMTCSMVFVHVVDVDGKKVARKFPKHPSLQKKPDGYYTTLQSQK